MQGLRGGTGFKNADAAVASLRGGGGLDPINQLRTAIGLDRLRIVSADPALHRITSYNVCYTKLLRIMMLFPGLPSL